MRFFLFLLHAGFVEVTPSLFTTSAMFLLLATLLLMSYHGSLSVSFQCQFCGSLSLFLWHHLPQVKINPKLSLKNSNSSDCTRLCCVVAGLLLCCLCSFLTSICCYPDIEFQTPLGVYLHSIFSMQGATAGFAGWFLVFEMKTDCIL